MKRKVLIVFAIVAGLFFSVSANSQMAKFESLYIYNICRYVEWPSGSNSGQFTIGIVGNNADLENNLKAISKSKVIQGKPVVIKKISDPADASACQILFFSKGSEAKIGSYLATTKNVLIASEKDGAIDKGSDINFFLESNRLRFDLGESNLSKKSLKVSADLTQLAASVK